MSNSFIWLIDRTLSVATIMGQIGSESDDYEGLLHVPQISKAIKWFSVIIRTLVAARMGDLTPLQRLNLYILLPKPTGLPNFLFSSS